MRATDVRVGDTRTEELVQDLSRTQIVQYAGASGDYNPLHSDDRFAREIAGYPTVFAHGMLTMGMTGRLLTDWFGEGALLRYGVRFQKQVWPGDTLTATGTVDALHDEGDGTLADVSVTTVNQDGDAVLSGSATVRLE